MSFYFPALVLLCPLARYFEVVSSNRKNSVFLRAKDPAMAQSWYNAILAGTANLLPRVKEEIRTKQPSMDVKHVGWITEQVCEGMTAHVVYSARTLKVFNFVKVSQCVSKFSLPVKICHFEHYLS